MKGKLIIFSAPSGSGKTTIVKQIMQSNDAFEFSISATSRSARENELEGKDYYFLTPEVFKSRIANNEFLEWEEVYPNQFYGTLKSEVERIRNKGHHVIFDVDVVGGVNIKKLFGDQALSVFVMPPSLLVLKERLILRGTETQESLEKRLSKAAFEITFSEKFDEIIINDSLGLAVKKAQEMIAKFISK